MAIEGKFGKKIRRITEPIENDSTFGVYNSQWKCISGGIHALAGDSEGAKAAVKSANRSVGVVGGGAVGNLSDL